MNIGVSFCVSPSQRGGLNYFYGFFGEGEYVVPAVQVNLFVGEAAVGRTVNLGVGHTFFQIGNKLVPVGYFV